MSRRLQTIGLCGLIVLAFGQVIWFFAPEDIYHLFPIHAVAGVALILCFLLLGGLRGVGSMSFGSSALKGTRVLNTALVVAALVILNIFVARYADFRLDVTEQKVHTLSPQLKEILHALKHKLKITAFFERGEIADARLKDLLERIASESSRVSLQVVDPEKKLGLIEKLGVSEFQTIHFAYDVPGAQRETKVTGELGESEIASAIKKLLDNAPKRICYAGGHGEPSLDDKKDSAGFLFAKEAIEGENVQVGEVLLANSGVSGDCQVLVIAAPKRALLPKEFEAVEEFLKKGGNALLFAEPQRSDDVARLARLLGIEVGNDIVLDQVLRLFSGAGVGVEVLTKNLGAHAITESFSEGVVFTTASSVRSVPSDPMRTEIVFTSENGWAERDVQKLSESSQASLDPGDLRGPVSLAVAYDGSLNPETHKGRVVVFGDVDFVSNGQLRQVYNRELLLRTVRWLLGEENGLVIPPRNLRASQEPITARLFSRIFLIAGVIFPEFLLLCGIIVTQRRKMS
jgi:hypothetical protein